MRRDIGHKDTIYYHTSIVVSCLKIYRYIGIEIKILNEQTLRQRPQGIKQNVLFSNLYIPCYKDNRVYRIKINNSVIK
jgi:hypothetical protein